MTSKTKTTKYYNITEISTQFLELSAKKQAVILWDALDYMQQHNSRTRFDCIAMALGYSNQEGEDDTYIKNSE